MDTLTTATEPARETDEKLTPMMQQWHACKKAAGNAILLFRMGDFYEAFYDDAQLLAKEADLALTKRQEVPMSGIPWHTCEAYIDKLIAKGYRIAIAEQTEDPKLVKGLVKREVVRIVTPGTLINSSLLSDKCNNYFASVAALGSLYALAFLDLTTAEFRVIEFENSIELFNEIYKIRPAEFLIARKMHDKFSQEFAELSRNYSCLINVHDDWHFDHQLTYESLVTHFKVHNLDGFGLKGKVAAINTAGALLKYLQDSLCLNVDHVQELSTYSTAKYLAIDYTTQRNLELTEALNEGSKKNSLLAVIDYTCTPMGARLLRRWIKQPLLDVSEILHRQEGVAAFYQHNAAADALRGAISEVKDLERLMMRISSGAATPRDLVALRLSLEPVPQLKAILQHLQGISPLLDSEVQKLDPLPQVTQRIASALVDEPPLRLNEGGIFREGFYPDLDELRTISRDSKSWIARYQNDLRESTGIKTLKVGFNRMFGYYIEVSKGQADKVGDQFQRRQTLVNAERFITPELKEYEEKVMRAEEKMVSLESELFSLLRQEIVQYMKPIMLMAQAIAQIDCLQSLGYIARRNNYTKPEVSDSFILNIEGGRHPVIESINLGEPFVPNDVHMDNGDNRLFLITGPNMAGKSTYLRQTALLVIMAQIGSFIPAHKAHIGIIDKVFSRIGASDDLSRGQSTFMVEMTETANILNHATSRSLVILDEIGRGTSTYDGISIAWSVAEYLLMTEGKMAKTLFATHYWELTKLEGKIPGAVNYNVAVHESHDRIVFLRKIVKGGTDKSYGIHVGQLAGLPPTVISRAKEILVHLEENANRKTTFEPPKPKKRAPKPQIVSQEIQLTLFG